MPGLRLSDNAVSFLVGVVRIPSTIVPGAEFGPERSLRAKYPTVQKKILDIASTHVNVM